MSKEGPRIVMISLDVGLFPRTLCILIAGYEDCFYGRYGYIYSLSCFNNMSLVLIKMHEGMQFHSHIQRESKIYTVSLDNVLFLRTLCIFIASYN